MSRPNDLKLQEIENLLPAYVIGALESDEMLAVDTFIRQQRDFLDRVQKIEERSALLTHLAKPIAPPANVRRTILMIARLDAPTEQISSMLPSSVPHSNGNGTHHKGNGYSNGTNGHGTNGHGSNGNGIHTNGFYPNGVHEGSPNGHRNGYDAGTNGSSNVTYAIAPYRTQQAAIVRRTGTSIPGVTRRRSITYRLWQVAATVALLALLAVASIGILLNRQLSNSLAQTSSSQTRVETLLTTNNRLLMEKEELLQQNQLLSNERQKLEEQIAAAQQQVDAVANAVRSTNLREVSDNGAAQAVVYTTQSGIAIAANGLPELPPEQTYQLWLIDTTNRAIPLAVFTVQPAETDLWREFSLPLSQVNYDAVAISVEKIGGSATPSKIVMRSIR